jgi:hypothetical protein
MYRHSYHCFKWILWIILTCFVTACAKPDVNCTTLISRGSYCLQPTLEIEPFELQQKVNIHFKGQNETLITNVMVNAEGMTAVGLTPFGHKLLEVRYNNQTTLATVLPNSRLEPAFLMAMLQLALWPENKVRSGLSPTLVLATSENQRRYLNQNKVILTIDYLGIQHPHDQLHIAFPTLALTLDIETLPEIEIEHE